MNAPLAFRRSALAAALAGALFAAGTAQAEVTFDNAAYPVIQDMPSDAIYDAVTGAMRADSYNWNNSSYYQWYVPGTLEGRYQYLTTLRAPNGNTTAYRDYPILTLTGCSGEADCSASGNTLNVVQTMKPADSPYARIQIAGGLAGGKVCPGASEVNNPDGWIELKVDGIGTASGDASNNKVTLSTPAGTGLLIGSAHGGLTISGNADNNTLTVRENIIADTVAAGAGLNTQNNVLTVEGDRVSAQLIAGSVGKEGGTHQNNTVNFTAENGQVGVIAGTLIVRTSDQGNTDRNYTGGENNTVNVTAGTGMNIGLVKGGASGYNTVNLVNLGTILRTVGGNGDGNKVTFDGNGRTDRAVGSYGDGGSNNTVHVKDGFVRSIFGSWSVNYKDGMSYLDDLLFIDTDATPHDLLSDNTVIIEGGSTGWLYAALSGNRGEKVTGNTVQIGEGAGQIGFWGPEPVIITGGQGTNEVSGNTVDIAGGTFVNAMIAGGVGESYAGSGIPREYTVKDNTVIIRNAPDLRYAMLFGGGDALILHQLGQHDDDFPGYDHGIIANNTLEVYDGDHVAWQIYNFDNLVFHIPSDVSNGHAMLTLTDENGTDISNTNVAAYVQAGARGHNLQAGDRVQLIANENGVTAENVTRQNFVARAGVALQHEFDLEATDTSLDAVLTRTTTQPDTTVVNTARTTALSTLAQMVDFTQNQSLRCPKDADGNQSLTCLWAAAGGTNYRYDMGANADYNRVHGSQFVMGVRGKLNDSASDEVTGAAFFETGRAKFKSAGLNSKATGDNEFYGFGTILRWAATDGALKGLYAEGNAQLGWSTSDMNAQLADSTYNVKFHNKAFGGAGLGAGVVFDLTNSLSLDTYARYQWTRINGGTVNVEGETFKFDSVDSQRARVGTRLEAAPSATFRAYVGAAFEREFDGKSTATIQGYDVNPTTLRGNYGLGEIGVRYTPADAKGWTFEGNLTGFAGKKDGFTGNITAAYKF